MTPEPSRDLVRLAALLRAPLDGVRARGSIDRALIALAARHRVAPLLYAAAQCADGPVEAGCMATLRAIYHDNRVRQAHVELLLKTLAAHFSRERIPWLVFKGLPQARRLYADAGWRQSTDVDLLLPAAGFATALDAFERARLALIDPPLPVRHWLTRAIARLTRDLQLEHRPTGIRFEVHRRLFFASRIEARVPILEKTFCPRAALDPGEIPAPGVDAGLALYLLLHGAATNWFRLKWLVDLVPLLAKLAPHEGAAVADAAEHLGAAVSVKAGLRLLELVFGEAPIGALRPWLTEATAAQQVNARLRRFLGALDNPSNHAATPANDKVEALKASYLLIDGFSYRAALLLRGPASSALRSLARLKARSRHRGVRATLPS